MKMFSKLEYVGMGQGKTSVLLTATEFRFSARARRRRYPRPGRALDQVFVIFCF